MQTIGRRRIDGFGDRNGLGNESNIEEINLDHPDIGLDASLLRIGTGRIKT